MKTKKPEHPNYESGQQCEFRQGKLRGGNILEDLGDSYLIGTYAPFYCEFIISKSEVKLYNKTEFGSEQLQ